MHWQPNVIPDALPAGRLHVGKLLSLGPLKTDAAKLVVDAVISTPTLDRDDEIVDPMGLKLEFYAINAPVCFAHMLTRPPIATSKAPDGSLSVWCSNEDVKAKGYFSEKVRDSETHFRMVEEGLLIGTSIGFRPLDPVRLSDEESEDLGARWPVIRHKACELTEWSMVPVGSNRYTVAHVVSKGMIGGHRLSDDIIRSLTPFVEMAGAWSNGWPGGCPGAAAVAPGVPPVTPGASQSNGQTGTKGTSEATMSQATPAAAATGAGTVPAGTTAVTPTQVAGAAAAAEGVKSEAAVAVATPPVVPQTKAAASPAGMADESNGDDREDADEPEEMKAGERMAQCILAYKSTMLGEMAKLMKVQDNDKWSKHAMKCMKADMGHINETLALAGEMYPDTEFEMADLPEMEDEDADESEEGDDEDADESEEGDDEDRSDDGDDDEKDEDEDDEKTMAECSDILDRMIGRR